MKRYPRKLLYLSLIHFTLLTGFFAGFSSELPLGKWVDSPDHLELISDFQGASSSLDSLQSKLSEITYVLKQGVVGRIQFTPLRSIDVQLLKIDGELVSELTDVVSLDFQKWQLSGDYYYVSKVVVKDIVNITLSPLDDDQNQTVSARYLPQKYEKLESLLNYGGNFLLLVNSEKFNSLYSQYTNKLRYMLFTSDLSHSEILFSFHGRRTWNKFISKFIDLKLPGVTMLSTDNNLSEDLKNANEAIPLMLALPTLVFFLLTSLTLMLVWGVLSVLKREEREMEKTFVNLGLKPILLLPIWGIEILFFNVLGSTIAMATLLVMIETIYHLPAGIVISQIITNPLSSVILLEFLLIVLFHFSISLADLQYIAPRYANSLIVKLLTRLPKKQELRKVFLITLLAWTMGVLYFTTVSKNSTLGWFTLFISYLPLLAYLLFVKLDLKVAKIFNKDVKRPHFKVFQRNLVQPLRGVFSLIIAAGVFFSFFSAVTHYTSVNTVYENGGEMSFQLPKTMNSSDLSFLSDIKGVVSYTVYHELYADDILPPNSLLTQDFFFLAIPVSDASRAFFKSFNLNGFDAGIPSLDLLKAGKVIVSPDLEMWINNGVFTFWFQHGNNESSMSLEVGGELHQLPGFSLELPFFKNDRLSSVEKHVLISEDVFAEIPSAEYSSRVYMRVDREMVSSVNQTLVEMGIVPSVTSSPSSVVDSFVFPVFMFFLGSIATFIIIFLNSKEGTRGDLTRFLLLMYIHKKEPENDAFIGIYVWTAVLYFLSSVAIGIFITTFLQALAFQWKAWWYSTLIVSIVGLAFSSLIVFLQKYEIILLKNVVKEHRFSVLLEGFTE